MKELCIIRRPRRTKKRRTGMRTRSHDTAGYPALQIILRTHVQKII